MKRTSIPNSRIYDEEIFESESISKNDYDDDASSLTITRNNSHLSDTDSLSDSSKKIRKKRNTYQKISDDIRVQLLEAVQNGETLKAAAKRHKINYSSAKSILHTYRKEGRILKKSAQERTTKKRSPSDSEFKQPSKATRSAKKENVQPDQSGDLPSLTVLERTRSEPAHLSGNEKSSLVSPKGGLKDNHLIMARTQSYEPHHQVIKEETPTLHAGYHLSEPSGRPFSVMDGDHTHGNDYLHHHHSRFAMPPKSRFFDYSMGHYDNHFNDMNVDHLLNHNHDHGHHDTYHDMTASWGFKPSFNEDYYHDHNSYFQKPSNMQSALEDKTNHAGMEHEEAGDHHNHFSTRSFFDTQKLINDLGKASVSGYNGNNSVYRKGSMDFYH